MAAARITLSLHGKERHDEQDEQDGKGWVRDKFFARLPFCPCVQPPAEWKRHLRRGYRNDGKRVSHPREYNMASIVHGTFNAEISWCSRLRL